MTILDLLRILVKDRFLEVQTTSMARRAITQLGTQVSALQARPQIDNLHPIKTLVVALSLTARMRLGDPRMLTVLSAVPLSAQTSHLKFGDQLLTTTIMVMSPRLLT